MKAQRFICFNPMKEELPLVLDLIIQRRLRQFVNTALTLVELDAIIGCGKTLETFHCSTQEDVLRTFRLNSG